jgi:hypothetical protein
LPAAISASILRPVEEMMRVDLHLVGAADALEGLLHQHAQDLVLGLARHVGDLVDEQRAAVRLLERADLARLPVDHLLDAEQLKLHALRHHRGRVDDDERPVGAGRVAVRSRAASSLPAPASDDEDAAVGRRALLDRRPQLVHRRRLADQVDGANCLSALTCA